MNLTKLPLVKQCNLLSIQLDEYKLKRKLDKNAWVLDNGRFFYKPEEAVLAIMQEIGYKGSLCEGGAILSLMKAACLNYLSKINIFNDRMDACLRYFEAQCEIYREQKDKIILEIAHSNESEIRKIFEEIYSYSFIESIYPGLNSDIIIGVWKALGSDKIAQIHFCPAKPKPRLTGYYHSYYPAKDREVQRVPARCRCETS